MWSGVLLLNCLLQARIVVLLVLLSSPWAGVKCILAASNFLALPTPDRAAVLDLLS